MLSLRLITYNVQLRSWTMEWLDAECDPFTRFTAPDRAHIIADRIVTSRYDYDVVVLNEVFCEESRGIILQHLESKYPYNIPRLIDKTFAEEDSGLMFFSR